MKQRKKSANWYVAATHYLTAGFVVPLLMGLLSAFVIIPMVETLDLPILSAVVSWIIMFLSIWLGIMYSARYLRSTYVITPENKNKIIKLATIYFAVINTFFLLAQAAVFGFFAFFLVAAAIAFFYFLSRKYVPVTSEESA